MGYNKCDVELEFVKRTDSRYQEIRERHYVPNKGCQGQQIHFLIWYKDEIVGIISGASSVYAVKNRDDFFKIPKNKEIKEKRYLPAIINNVVFRLENHEPNLATKVLSKFRKVSTKLWAELYGVDVIGFETFVVEEDYRKGALYKADNWTFVGQTVGSAKSHNGLINKSKRKETCVKLIFCKWVNKPVVPQKEYISSWRNKTIEEKDRNKHITKLKSELIGQKF